MPELAVILPAYNVEDAIAGILRQLKENFPQAAVVVVDDGSTDRTAAIVRQFAHVQLLSHAANLGKGAALKTGIRIVRSQIAPEWYAFMDADGQHAPADLKKLVLAARANKGDFLIGRRDFRPGLMPIPRILSNRITSWLISRKIGHCIRDSQSGMRVIKRTIIETMPELASNGYEFESEFLLKAGRMPVTFFEVPIGTRYSSERSHIRPLRDVARFIKVYLTT